MREVTAIRLSSTPPSELTPSLRPWGPVSKRIVRLCSAYPPLFSRILCACSRHLHIIVIFLINQPTDEDATIAQLIYNKHPRDLLKMAWPACSAGLYPALKRCGHHAMPCTFYKILNELLQTEIAQELALAPALTSVVVEYLHQTRHLDPLVRPARCVLGHNVEKALAFHSTLKIARALGVIGDEAVEAKALRAMGTQNIQRYLSKRFEKCVSPVFFELKFPLRQLRTGAELSEIGHAMNNCLGKEVQYTYQLGVGSHIFIVYLGRGMAFIASFELGPCNDWWMDQCQSEGGKSASDDIRSEITELLNESGVRAHAHGFHKTWCELGPRFIESLEDM